ncbi:hypothetical protein D9M71_387620 [compost metagenome]
MLGEAFEAATVADIQRQHRGAHTRLLQRLHQRLGFLCLAVIGADNVDALGRQVQRGIFAQAAAGAGDQCDFPIHALYLGVRGEKSKKVYWSADC